MMEKYKDHWKKGIYKCSKCGNKLFNSEDKFNSGTNWPSFRKSIKNGVKTKLDLSFLMVRTELLCKKCGEHLGHVFKDGKLRGDEHKDAGKRYCILSDSLKFGKK